MGPLRKEGLQELDAFQQMVRHYMKALDETAARRQAFQRLAAQHASACAPTLSALLELVSKCQVSPLLRMLTRTEGLTWT